MKLNQKGEGKAGLFFGLLILGAVVFVGAKVIPVAIRVFSFEDSMQEECKYNATRPPNVIQQRVFEKAKKEDLPIDLDDITVQRIENQLKVDVTYTVQITFPGYVYNWDRHAIYDAPVF